MTVSILQVGGELTGDPGLIFALAAVTAIAGLFVAYQAYRGYERNESRPMLYLAIGIVLLTAVPVGLNWLLSLWTASTDAEILLVVTTSHLAGVLTILYALTRA